MTRLEFISLPWALQMGVLFFGLIAIMLAAVWLNDAIANRVNNRRAHRRVVTQERRRP